MRSQFDWEKNKQNKTEEVLQNSRWPESGKLGLGAGVQGKLAPTVIDGITADGDGEGGGY
jgi:hypothetical protein